MLKRQCTQSVFLQRLIGATGESRYPVAGEAPGTRSHSRRAHTVPQRRRLSSYDGLHAAKAYVWTPRTIDELLLAMKQARQQARHITFRSGGRSFDGQALNDEAVIDLRRLNRILEIDPLNRRITVEAGACWGDIVRALRPFGLLPYNLVSARYATAGGTLSSNCFSRFSFKHGREGCQVHEFKLLTVEGELLTCNRTMNADVFHGAIGGLGYLGAIVEVTYNLLHVGARTQIQTVLSKYGDVEQLLQDFALSARPSSEDDGVSAVIMRPGSKARGLLMRLQRVGNVPPRPMLAATPVLLLLALLIRLPGFHAAIWELTARIRRTVRPYVDDGERTYFYMDGHDRLRRWAARLGVSLPTTRQEFILPRQHLLEFIRELERRLQQARLTPTVVDVEAIQADDFLLSANRQLSGDLVGVMFEGLRQSQMRRAQELLLGLADYCSELGGRVSMIKNVLVAPETLREMYGAGLAEFLALKRRLDPRGRLRNQFFERAFGLAG
jgi:decaprenylphospho-beta-D-ribofuranose 2-oxidase